MRSLPTFKVSYTTVLIKKHCVQGNFDERSRVSQVCWLFLRRRSFQLFRENLDAVFRHMVNYVVYKSGSNAAKMPPESDAARSVGRPVGVVGKGGG